ncbi:hypothetical protein EG68_09690 [Paragonimus skrjabini miyazakii]|uniref:Uncharacterized protein n=1 Tax=Paragonimus skrjabini miyazakii TaxID=59628 RepID=A0A8S9YHA0_9TREM|nr:hypothetical protein EG68_09690 [Paragonimus skrjabini miyazakii]
MDTDMIANAHIGELWQHFNQFTSEQVFGMVHEHTPEYYDKFGSKFWKNVKPGYNAGLVLMHLRKLRSFNWRRTWTRSLNFLLRNMGALANPEQASPN